MNLDEQNGETAQKMSPLEAINLKFERSRNSISQEIQNGALLLKEMKNLIEAHVKFLSLRQRLLEENHKLIESFNKQNKKYKETRSKEYKNLTENNNYRYQSTEKDKVIDGMASVSQLKTACDTISSQIEFYRESIKTVDQVLFAFKMRIEMHNILEGSA